MSGPVRMCLSCSGQRQDRQDRARLPSAGQAPSEEWRMRSWLCRMFARGMRHHVTVTWLCPEDRPQSFLDSLRHWKKFVIRPRLLLRAHLPSGARIGSLTESVKRVKHDIRLFWNLNWPLELSAPTRSLRP